VNGIIKASIGWVVAGLVAGAVWAIVLYRGVHDPGMLLVSIFVLFIGFCIMAFNKSIAKIRDSIIASKAKKP
jgi:xanthosine utilization system XapX-like protein